MLIFLNSWLYAQNIHVSFSNGLVGDGITFGYEQNCKKSNISFLAAYRLQIKNRLMFLPNINEDHYQYFSFNAQDYLNFVLGARKNFRLKNENKIFAQVQTKIGCLSKKEKVRNFETNETMTFFTQNSVYIEPAILFGASFALSRKLSFETILGLSTYFHKDQEPEIFKIKPKWTGDSLLPNLQLGFSYTLVKKSE